MKRPASAVSRLSHRALVAPCALFLLAGVAFAQEGGPNLALSAKNGLATSSGPSSSVVLDQLPPITDAQAKAHPPVPPPRSGVSEAVYQARKAQAAVKNISPSTPGEAPADSGVVDTPTGAGFTGIGESCSFLIPPDQALAVGATWVLEVVNACVGVYSKAGALQAGYPKSLNSFFGLSSSAFTFDPRALYDFVNNRYIVMADLSTATQSYIMVAASKTNDPRGGWNIYSLAVGGSTDFADFPTLGQDRQAIYVGFTNFLGAGGISNYVLYLPKSQIYSGAAFSYYYNFNFNVGGVNVDSIQPANVMNLSDQPRAEFMVNSFNINFGGGQCSSGCNGLVVWAISNPLVASGSPGPEVTGVVISTANNYSLPPNARQPGCSSGSCLLDTGDTRISGEVTYASGSLFAALNTAATAGPGATFIWYRVQPILNDNDARCTGAFLNACPQITTAYIREEQCYFCSGRGANGSSWYGTLQPDPEGNVVAVYAYSDDNSYPGLAYVSKRVTATVLHDNGLYLYAGQHFYNQQDQYGRNRWGDYTGVAGGLLVPTQGVMWFAGEFSDASGNWRSAMGHTAFNNPKQP